MLTGAVDPLLPLTRSLPFCPPTPPHRGCLGPSGWVVDVLCFLCISHCGLAEDELLQLLDTMGYRDHHKVTAVHWAAFRQATKTWIRERPNGLLCFHHQSLRNAVEHKLLGEELTLKMLQGSREEESHVQGISLEEMNKCAGQLLPKLKET